MLGQGKSHGMALLGKTKNDNFPNGLAWDFVSKAKKANKPSDASAVIGLEVELDCLQLRGMRVLYNDVIKVMDKYVVMKTDRNLFMLMVQKNQEALYARLIMDECKSSSLDFVRLYNDMSEIQRLTRIGNKWHIHEKEVHLSSGDD
jgi:predicted transport protein